MRHPIVRYAFVALAVLLAVLVAVTAAQYVADTIDQINSELDGATASTGQHLS